MLIDQPPTRPSEPNSKPTKLTQTHLSINLSPSSTISRITSRDLKGALHVVLVVYDLLPAGKLSNIAWYLGVGLYHSAIRIPELGREFAFGGHPNSDISGIFSLPIRSDGKPPMPGLRLVSEVDMGQIRTNPLPQKSSLPRNSSTSTPTETRRLMRSSASTRSSVNTSSSVQSPTSTTHSKASAYPTIQEESLEMAHDHSQEGTSSASSMASDVSDLTPNRTQLETFEHVLTQLDESPDWRGTSYDLLRRNCNTFSDELCMLLTGRRTPGWINRAAAVGTALPCLVPEGWIEPPIVDITPPPSTSTSTTPQAYEPPKQEMRI
ncbi:uncharacterized protein MELLADRAFT_115382 [Melampsora larici-populina 98AG31]|uniref:PPPDE domain-containing protein n=1 Tax=Melampsora larici-populina (strain 98AG31 / pathotype 3-4-7) TaxID=747676 RepID=F4R9S5_MELLP|nr:uncharacterized protein MELLADRAFT_115382 [Melampsora larici-populina 98AG31]EGG11100.1 hypothetical protein MELLADRAFT_115382 [Melampsora larici-populina 98AG31]